MKFCVLAKVSKRSVSFWYQSDGNAYAPLSIKESNEIPLYFYVSGNDFIFGGAARERFNRHDPNAYGNYFEIIKDPSKHFIIYGNKKPVKQLFYYGVEQCLSHFLNTVLYKVDSIESYRQHFPLRFLFDTDIEDKEKSLIENLFQEAGYFNLDRIHFNKILFGVLVQKEILVKEKAILLLSAIDDVLYLKLYKNANAEEIGSFKLEGQGADPRVKILANMIVEYIISQNPYLSIDKDIETAFLLPFCVSLLENPDAIIKGDAELADGNKYWFKVNERNLTDRLQYYSNDNMIYTAIDDLLKSSSLTVQDVVILLGTEAISTSYFSGKLLKRYHYVKEVTSAAIKDTMKSVFEEVSSSNYTVKSKAPPVLVRPRMPAAVPIEATAPKLPPPLPPKKEKNSSQPQINIPRLPEVKPVIQVKVNPVKLPPLPPKKGT
ncbi:hypothetical protein HDE69_004574 [Pedobacter cryoconitis]|uniref:Uncharacterized protein n=1 Tax=Pedobacter cryoconitis TaxID=188932 RepID=A0A7W8YXS8_9SPHI|nr:hypothetical protein [Pedobacter cryoconitis]MBB5623488.1 hypothetical protein [Pedobacter cryoconitis]